MLVHWLPVHRPCSNFTDLISVFLLVFKRDAASFIELRFAWNPCQTIYNFFEFTRDRKHWTYFRNSLFVLDIDPTLKIPYHYWLWNWNVVPTWLLCPLWSISVLCRTRIALAHSMAFLVRSRQQRAQLSREWVSRRPQYPKWSHLDRL